jgi:hypothetical protein
VDIKKASEFLRDFSIVGCIKFSEHCAQRMAERNIQADDLMMVLLWGDVQDVRYEPDYDTWKCRIDGKTLDNDDVTFIAAIDIQSHSVFCITVY